MSDKVCSHALCDQTNYAKGFCRSHYERDLKVRNPEYAERQRQNVRRWVEQNPERKRRSDRAWERRTSYEYRRSRLLRSKYGITIEEFDRMLAEQNGCCALCGRAERRWHIDHDHATGAVRGILCSKCNCALGWFNEDPNLLRRAADYLG